ncbi:MAG: hypothetical protein ACJAYU_003025 [Bradymonadia bacterium]
MSAATDVYEKLGAFYLGRHHDVETGETASDPVLYDSRDLLTHAVCVGMTGSGKTGLCVGLLEEAAIDGVPALVIDPKGDLGNLLLTFPDLAPGDFEPWVSAEDARRKDMEVGEFAAHEAEKWRDGLASWGQTAERIRKLRESADFAIYTPGSSAGIQLSIIKSFSAPPQEIRDDRELFQDQISTTVSSILGLLGVDADPIQSREHILLSNILAYAWNEDRDVDLPGLISEVQAPPFERVGVMDLETFYPEKERFKLSMRLNNLVASPGFSSWTEGEPLDVDRLLYTPDGRPRICVLSISHLSEDERMFFVALLFNEVLGWMRTQPGSRNLRALLYMDEIFGYIPPVANPPSKKPLLTLLKQARAFGLGIVLATQNPVDLDYKALSNAGTWFIGRLQTAQDKARLLDALDGASATAGESFDRQEVDRIISGLGKRVFLLHNVHEPAPVVFQTRWAMSYLRGPLVREEIKTLMAPRKQALAESEQPARVTAAEAVTETIRIAATKAPERSAPAIPSTVMQRYAPINRLLAPAGTVVNYRPALLATARLAFNHARSGVVSERQAGRLATFTDADTLAAWDRSIPVTLELARLREEPEPIDHYAALPSIGHRSESYTTWRKSFSDYAYRNERLSIFRSASFSVYSRLGEDERAFRIRLQSLARDKRDELGDKLRDKFEGRVRRLEEKIRTAQQRVDREKAQARRAKVDAGTRVGVALFDAIFGSRRSAARGTATSLRAGARAREQGVDVEQAEDKLDELLQDKELLTAELQAELEAIEVRIDPMKERLENVEIAPRRKDVTEERVVLVWLPVARDEAGNAKLAFELN